MYIPAPPIEEIRSLLPMYEDLQYLTTGGFKVVHSGRHVSGNPEAIKAIFIPSEDRIQVEVRDQLIARAKREIHALSEGISRTMVRLGELEAREVQLGGETYIVYSEEFVEGSPLSGRVEQNNQVPFTELKSLMLHMVDLIEALWGRNYLHRDIKPANIIETGNSDRPYVVLDMGIAYKMSGTELTLGPTPPGTLRYTPPELLRAGYREYQDYRSDLYSLGVTVFELAAAQNPYVSGPQDAATTIHKVLNESPPKLVSLRPDLSARFCCIIERCMKKRIANRYSRLDQLKNALLEVTS